MSISTEQPLKQLLIHRDDYQVPESHHLIGSRVSGTFAKSKPKAESDKVERPFTLGDGKVKRELDAIVDEARQRVGALHFNYKNYLADRVEEYINDNIADNDYESISTPIVDGAVYSYVTGDAKGMVNTVVTAVSKFVDAMGEMMDYFIRDINLPEKVTKREQIMESYWIQAEQVLNSGLDSLRGVLKPTMDRLDQLSQESPERVEKFLADVGRSIFTVGGKYQMKAALEKALGIDRKDISNKDLATAVKSVVTKPLELRLSPFEKALGKAKEV